MKVSLNGSEVFFFIKVTAAWCVAFITSLLASASPKDKFVWEKLGPV